MKAKKKGVRPISQARAAEIALAMARSRKQEPPIEAAQLPPLKLRVPVSPNDADLLRSEIKDHRMVGHTHGSISFTEFLDYLELYERMK